MKKIRIQNEFTQWAEYLARYFGENLAIYDLNGDLMYGSNEDELHLTQAQLINRASIYPIYKDIAEPIAYYDGSSLTNNEYRILNTIIPFIEAQLDDEGD